MNLHNYYNNYTYCHLYTAWMYIETYTVQLHYQNVHLRVFTSLTSTYSFPLNLPSWIHTMILNISGHLIRMNITAWYSLSAHDWVFPWRAHLMFAEREREWEREGGKQGSLLAHMKYMQCSGWKRQLWLYTNDTVHKKCTYHSVHVYTMWSV